VEFFGRKAHAAAAPDKGINALDGLVLFYQAASLARQQFPPGCLFHGVIEDGGRSANVIPDYARGRFALRAERMDALELLNERIQACARAAAEATGCRVSVKESGHSVTTFKRNRSLEDLFAGLLESIGRSEPRKIRRSYGSTDLASVSQAVAAIEVFVKASDHPIHTEGFARDAVAAGGDRALLDGVFLLAAGGYHLLNDSDLRQSVRRDFAAAEQQAASTS
jgi:metal-dependent amidase/aminoacylase/carboxypeptidase family protein